MDRERFPGLFATSMLKTPTSLAMQAEGVAVEMITKVILLPNRKFWRVRVSCREHLRKSLHSHIVSKLLSRFVPHYDGPGDDPSVVWNFPCFMASAKVRCRIHRECILMWSEMERILELLVHWNSESLKFSLRKVSPEHFSSVMNSVMDIIQPPKLKGRPCLLKEIVIAGGSLRSDSLVDGTENMAFDLRHGAPHVKILKLPVISDLALKHLSRHPKLEQLFADRSKLLSYRGFLHLAGDQAHTRKNLVALAIEIYASQDVRKVDIAFFLNKMERLRYFSLGDEERSLYHDLKSYDQSRDQVFVYSALRLSLLEIHRSESAVTSLEKINVVDRRVNPSYLLKMTPKIKALYIDWQEELSERPFSYFKRDWFRLMLAKPEWKELGGQLLSVEVISPAIYTSSESAFSVTDDEVRAILNTCPLLERLKITGGGWDDGNLHISEIVRRGKNLKFLVLDNCDVIFSIPQCLVKSDKLISFNFICRFIPDGITSVIPTLMPNLRDLEIQPNNSSIAGRFKGFSEMDVMRLSQLKSVKRLSLPLGFHAFTNNMPNMVCALRNFHVLRNLVVSWGATLENYTFSNSRVTYMTRWLKDALRAENADIRVELCYHIHHSIYTRTN